MRSRPGQSLTETPLHGLNTPPILTAACRQRLVKDWYDPLCAFNHLGPLSKIRISLRGGLEKMKSYLVTVLLLKLR